MEQTSPTITDILDWITQLNNPLDVNQALNYVVPILLKDPAPVYAQRNQIFQHLKNRFGTSTPPIIPPHVYQNLPYPIAHALSQANQHSYSRLVQLLFLFDAVEIAIRWLISLYVAAILHENYGGLPTRLADNINGSIARPTFGKWVGILRELKGGIKNKNFWSPNTLPVDTPDIDMVLNQRNNVAHGNPQGGLVQELQQTVDATINIMTQTQDLLRNNLSACWKGQESAFLGDTIVYHGSTQHRDGIFFRYQQDILEFPVLFLFAPHPTHPFDPLVLSFISTKAKLQHASEGKPLDYVEINGTEVSHIEDVNIITSFIETFQTDTKISSDHPWCEELENASSAQATAWNFEKLHIKFWKKTRENPIDATQKIPHILWFGGGAETGRTTVLQGALHNLKDENKGNFLFLHTFPTRRELDVSLTPEEYYHHQLDRFLRRFRDAIVHWSQEHIQTNPINNTLTKNDLFLDLYKRLQLFLAIDKLTNSPTLMVGLDGVENLYFDTQPENPKGATLLLECLKKLYIISEGTYKTGIEPVKETRLRICFFATGRSSANLNDADGVFDHSLPEVDWLFDPKTLATIQNNIPAKNYKSLIPSGHQTSPRLLEIQNYNAKLPKGQRGAHLPPIGLTGIKDLFVAYDKSLIKLFTPPSSTNQTNPHQGTIFLQEVYQKALGKPRYVDSIAQKLISNEVTIHSDLSQVSALSTYFQSRLDDEFISDERRIIAFVICVLHHLHTKASFTSLTAESLQMLHDWQFKPDPDQVEVVKRAIHSAQGLLQAIPQSTSNADGTLVYSWALSSDDVARGISNNKDLASTIEETERCVLWFQKNHAKIAEGTELKTFFAPQLNIQNPENQNINAFLYTFRAFTKASQEKILEHQPLAPAQKIFQKIQTPLLASSSTWNAQRAWLQRCIEMEPSDSLYKEADSFLKTSSATFTDLWLKQCNPQRLPLYDHEKGSFLSPDKVSQILPLKNGFYLIKGMSPDNKFQNATLYHVSVTYALDQWSDANPVDCCITKDASGAYILVFATTTHVHFYRLLLKDIHSYQAQPLKDYPYAKVTGIITLPNNNIVVYGNASTEEIDISNSSLVRSWPTPTNNRSSLLNGFVENGHVLLQLGSSIIYLPLSGGNVGTHPIQGGTINEIHPILDQAQNRVGTYTFSGSNTNAYASRIDSLPPLPLQPPQKYTTKPVAMFAYGTDLLIVYIYGTIALFSGGVQIDLETELKAKGRYVEFFNTNPKIELRGALLCNNELILYGKHSFLTSITLQGSNPSSWGYHEWPLEHYGNGFITELQVLQHQEYQYPGTLLLSQSDDNDIRMWQLSNRSCVGLFRAHKDKLKTMQQYGSNLLSADVKRNVCIWEFNQSAIQQRNPPTLQRQSPFVSKTSVYQNQAIVIDQDLQIRSWPQQGSQWSQSAALVKPPAPFTFGTFSSCIEIPTTPYLVVLISGVLWIIDKSTLQTQKFNVYTDPKTEKDMKWKVLGINNDAPGSTHIVVFGQATPVDAKRGEASQTHHFLAKLDTQGILQHYFSLDQTISAVAPNTAQSVVFVCEDGKQKRICDYTWGATQEITRHSFVHSAGIKGIFVGIQKLLCWDSSSGRATSFFYEEKQVLYKNIQNPNCTHGPRNILEDTKGIVFSNSDGQGRWRISLEMGVPLLSTISSEMYVLSNFDRVYHQKLNQKQHNTLSGRDFSLFVESSEYGINLFYKNSDVVRQITWIGLMMRGFSVGGLYPNGRILANKNREVIVLQLMRGNKKITFADLGIGD